MDMGVADFQRQMSKREFGATVIWGLLVISLCLIVPLGSGYIFLLLEGGGVVSSCPPSPVQKYGESIKMFFTQNFEPVNQHHHVFFTS